MNVTGLAIDGSRHDPGKKLDRRRAFAKACTQLFLDFGSLVIEFFGNKLNIAVECVVVSAERDRIPNALVYLFFWFGLAVEFVDSADDVFPETEMRSQGHTHAETQ